MKREDEDRAELIAALRAPSFQQDSKWHDPNGSYVTKPRALIDAAADMISSQPLPVTPESVAAERVRDAAPATAGDTVEHSVYLSAVWGRRAFRDAYRRTLPVVKAAETLASKWATKGQMIDSDDFYAAINDVFEAVVKRNADPAITREDVAIALGPVREEGSSSCTESGGTAQGPKSDSPRKSEGGAS